MTLIKINEDLNKMREYNNEFIPTTHTHTQTHTQTHTHKHTHEYTFAADYIVRETLVQMRCMNSI